MPALPDIEAGVASGHYTLLTWPDVKPGDAILFSAMIVHGQRQMSDRRQQRQPRRSVFRRLATRWTGPDARYVLRDGDARDVIPSKFFPCTLSPGDEMECERFPHIWSADTGLVMAATGPSSSAAGAAPGLRGNGSRL
jgi:hypothetical protein